jgi:hypothetical protein
MIDDRRMPAGDLLLMLNSLQVGDDAEAYGRIAGCQCSGKSKCTGRRAFDYLDYQSMHKLAMAVNKQDAARQSGCGAALRRHAYCIMLCASMTTYIPYAAAAPRPAWLAKLLTE